MEVKNFTTDVLSHANQSTKAKYICMPLGSSFRRMLLPEEAAAHVEEKGKVTFWRSHVAAGAVLLLSRGEGQPMFWPLQLTRAEPEAPDLEFIAPRAKFLLKLLSWQSTSAMAVAAGRKTSPFVWFNSNHDQSSLLTY